MGGIMTNTQEKMLWCCVYCDTSGLFSAEELENMNDNLVDIEFPSIIVHEWYEQRKKIFDYETARELKIPIESADFDKWFYEVSDADDTDGLCQFARERGFNPQICRNTCKF